MEYKANNLIKYIPERFKDAQMSDIEPAISKRMEDMVIHKTKPFRSFYLYGDTGVGKTHTIYAIKKFLKENNLSAMVVKSYDILRAIRQTFIYCRDDDPRLNKILDENDFLEDITFYKGMLIIDDIGYSEKDTPAVLDRFFEIIDERCEEGGFTSYSSNFSPNELVPKLGKRIVDRMMMKCDPIELVGVDRRLQ